VGNSSSAVTIPAGWYDPTNRYSRAEYLSHKAIPYLADNKAQGCTSQADKFLNIAINVANNESHRPSLHMTIVGIQFSENSTIQTPGRTTPSTATQLPYLPADMKDLKVHTGE
jgi:hypothetical protein